MSILNLFNIWNTLKQITHHKETTPQFSDKEIWWVQFGKNIASEMYGKGEDFLRPAIILRKVFDNACIIIPLTSQKKQGSYYFCFKDHNNNKQYAVMHQVRYIDAKRLIHKFGEIKEKDFHSLKQRFIDSIIKITPQNIEGNL